MSSPETSNDRHPDFYMYYNIIAYRDVYGMTTNCENQCPVWRRESGMLLPVFVLEILAA
jgi:hypothetical protein